MAISWLNIKIGFYDGFMMAHGPGAVLKPV